MRRLTEAQRTVMDNLRGYNPCETGIHFLGFETVGGEERYRTLANIRTQTVDDARALFNRLLAEFEKEHHEPDDILVDLYENTDLIDCFWITRQMLDRCVSAGREALRKEGEDQ